MNNEIVTSSRKAVIYCRVSTREQVNEGNSLVSQERLCREFAAKEGYEVAEIFIEKGESAKTQNRKQLQTLLAYCSEKKSAVNAVIAYKVDRISRNLADYSYIKVRLKKMSIEIKSVTEFFEDTPAGRFMENIIANVGQFDNDVRAERSLGGMKEAMLEGRYVWKAPPGFSNVKLNGKSTIAPNENAALIKETFQMIADKMHSVEVVRLLMIEKGLVNSLGKPLHRSYFFLLIRNPLYTGKIKKFGRESQGTFTPIISEELFNDVQDVLNGRLHKTKHYLKDNPDFPLRRFVRNSTGKQLTGYWSKGRNAKYPYYSFCEPGTTIRKERLEKKFEAFLSQFSLGEVELGKLREYLTTHFSKNVRDEISEKGAIQKRIQEIEALIDNLIRLEINGSISSTAFESRVKKLEFESTELKDLLKNKEAKNVDVEQLYTFAAKILKKPELLWKKASVETKKRLQWFDFPDGLIFDGENFKTEKTCRLFNLKNDLNLFKSIRVPSNYTGTNTYNAHGEDLRREIVKTKPYWQEIIKDLQKLNELTEG